MIIAIIAIIIIITQAKYSAIIAKLAIIALAKKVAIIAKITSN